jgi:hypothetical protein
MTVLRNITVCLILAIEAHAQGVPPRPVRARPDDSIKATVQARRNRQQRRNRAAAARAVEIREAMRQDAIAAEAMRKRVMENQAHAAQVQHAINGAVANAVQSQSNAVQAQRNQVLHEMNIAIMQSRGVLICSRCGQYGHTICGR